MNKIPQTLTCEIEDFLDNVVSRLPAARDQNVCLPFQQCYFVQLNARKPCTATMCTYWMSLGEFMSYHLYKYYVYFLIFESL